MIVLGSMLAGLSACRTTARDSKAHQHKQQKQISTQAEAAEKVLTSALYSTHYECFTI
jgi:Flp pilus assembly protein TadD